MGWEYLVRARRRRRDRRRPRHRRRAAAAAAAVAHPVVAGEGETGRETESARGLKGERIAAAAVAQQGCSAQAERTRTGLRLLVDLGWASCHYAFLVAHESP